MLVKSTLGIPIITNIFSQYNFFFLKPRGPLKPLKPRGPVDFVHVGYMVVTPLATPGRRSGPSLTRPGVAKPGTAEQGHAWPSERAELD